MTGLLNEERHESLLTYVLPSALKGDNPFYISFFSVLFGQNEKSNSKQRLTLRYIDKLVKTISNHL